MRREREAANIRRLLWQAGLLLVIAWLLFETVDIYRKHQIAEVQLRGATQKHEELLVREQTLTKKVEELESDRGEEMVIREDLGGALPGEEVIIIERPEIPEEPPLPLPWWRRLLGFVGL